MTMARAPRAFAVAMRVADGGPQPPVAGARGPPGEGEGDGGRDAEDVAVGRDGGGREVAVVDVDRHDRVLAQLVQGRGGCRGGLPSRVDVPAITRRVVADVIADRAVGRLGGDLVTPVGERDGSRQPVPAVRPVRQVRERGGQLDLQPALIGVASGSSRSPTPCPSPRQRSGTAGPIPTAAATGPRSGPAAARLPRLRSRAFPPRTTDTAPVVQLPLHPAEPCLQRLEPDGLGVPLGGGGIPARPARLPACRNRQPGLDRADAGLQAGLPGAQVLLCQPDLVLVGAARSPRPTGTTRPPSAPASARPGTLPCPSRPAAPRRTGPPGPFPPATPGERPPPAAPPHPPASTRSRARTRPRPPPPPPGGGRQSPPRPLTGGDPQGRTHTHSETTT